MASRDQLCPAKAWWQPSQLTDRKSTRLNSSHGYISTLSLHDALPISTVMEAAGLQLPTEWDGQSRPALPGKSLVATFTADVPVQRECLWWLHEGNRAVRTGDWKLVAAKNEAWELYDLATDRAEQVNLAARLPDKARELEILWQKYTDQFTALAAPTATEPQKKSKKK